MGLFSKFKKKGEPSPAATPAAAPASEKKEVPAQTQKPIAPQKPASAEKKPVAPQPSAPKPVAPQSAAPKPAAPAKKPAAPAAKKPVTSEKAPAPKTVPSVKKASTPMAKPASKPAAGATAPRRPATVGRPFFVTTEEDIKAAFDAAIADAEAEIAANGARAVGKYEFNLEVDGYHFYLLANNGQVLFDSPSFTTLIGALNGIKTFKKTVSAGTYVVKADKYNRYRFIFSNKYYGENYTTKEQCAKCAESVQNFATNARIIPYQPDREALLAYEAAKSAKNTPENINWDAIAQAEKVAERKGKFEISREENGEYCFYLLANNAQILYSSRYFSNETACRRGIDSFKRAAYVGNFFVDRDKFGNYRYVLKNIGSAPSFIGESYDNKSQCEKIIESVKNFIVTASIEVAEDAAE